MEFQLALIEQMILITYSSTNFRIESNEAKSKCLVNTDLLPDWWIISMRDASALTISLQQMYTFAPRFAKSMAVSRPIPVLAPWKYQQIKPCVNTISFEKNHWIIQNTVINTTFPSMRTSSFLNCPPWAQRLIKKYAGTADAAAITHEPRLSAILLLYRVCKLQNKSYKTSFYDNVCFKCKTTQKVN